MSHQEYIAQQRRRVAALARQILAREVDVLEAACEIARLRSAIDAEGVDDDLAAFSLVESEAESLPIGKQREYWAEGALARKEPELNRVRDWAFRTVEEECHNLVRRFVGSK